MPLTQADRQKAHKNSLIQRRKQQQERREQAKKMFDTGMSKSEIARQLGVEYRTIWDDLRQA